MTSRDHRSHHGNHSHHYGHHCSYRYHSYHSRYGRYGHGHGHHSYHGHRSRYGLLTLLYTDAPCVSIIIDSNAQFLKIIFLISIFSICQLVSFF